MSGTISVDWDNLFRQCTCSRHVELSDNGDQMVLVRSLSNSRSPPATGAVPPTWWLHGQISHFDISICSAFWLQSSKALSFPATGAVPSCAPHLLVTWPYFSSRGGHTCHFITCFSVQHFDCHHQKHFNVLDHGHWCPPLPPTCWLHGHISHFDSFVQYFLYCSKDP